ncbi:HEAT repeat domain-containing protein [Paenibacillus allorhizosphaerae]|uniref:Phytanoyl-CoA dioxygenase n=1 Tax=Paenibacillus allorhizosphaerae TaxID=2849866 RepID=A0ABM8VDM7_9BACL|nr:HEAT repeat domain-containing protein [Paenibacillus allorhizosphaerae]CAG7628175.1 hypothetical protein PAECIP111802_01430 [Paenibacillus allorhizosphaerae]
MSESFLLNDEQMRKFISEGFLILNTDFPESFHASLFNQLNEVYGEEGNPGNNILPRIPELQKVFDHPVIQGALTSVLGENYMMHPHRHGHFNKKATAGGWHKDSYWGHQRVRNHRPWWAMIFYFPQDVTIDMGPTGVVPGTGCYQTRTFESDDTELEVTSHGKAGTFALVQYDIWHRATANISGKDRYMLKFQFVRTNAPTKPTWNNASSEWITPAGFTKPIVQHELIWRDTWNWLTGQQQDASASIGDRSVSAADEWIAQLQSDDRSLRAKAADELGLIGEAAAAQAVPALAATLNDAFEPVALNAAYSLGRMGEQGLRHLLGTVENGSGIAARSAAYGAYIAGPAAIDGLTAIVRSGSADAASYAAFALGELGRAAAPAVPALIERLRNADADAKVRRTVIETLGMIGATEDAVVAALEQALQDADDQVRFMAGLSLSRLGAQADKAVPAIVKALDDDNRYVRANAAEALYYIGTEQAKNALLKFLRTSRWCSTTTPKTTF